MFGLPLLNSPWSRTTLISSGLTIPRLDESREHAHPVDRSPVRAKQHRHRSEQAAVPAGLAQGSGSVREVGTAT